MAKQVVHTVWLAPETVRIIREQNVRQVATIERLTDEVSELRARLAAVQGQRPIKQTRR